jgi:peptide/nickel transport system permease protein
MSQSTLLETSLQMPASQGRRMWVTFFRNRTAVIGIFMVLIVIFVSFGAPLITPYDPLAQSPRDRLEGPSAEHLMGRDAFGRDIFTRVLYAGRVSLLVGVSSVMLGGVLGVFIGLIAAYFGGIVETVLMRLVDILMAFPSLILGLVVMAVLGGGALNMILAIGIVFAPGFARVVHATTLSLKQQEFILAAQAVGAGHPRIMFNHILPNTLGEIIVLGSLWTASAIRIETSLSFIGLGISPPTPTWGNIIRDGTQFIFDAPWYSVFPGLAIFFTVLGLNLMGDGLRDILDPRLRE